MGVNDIIARLIIVALLVLPMSAALWVAWQEFKRRWF